MLRNVRTRALLDVFAAAVGYCASIASGSVVRGALKVKTAGKTTRDAA